MGKEVFGTGGCRDIKSPRQQAPGHACAGRDDQDTMIGPWILALGAAAGSSCCLVGQAPCPTICSLPFPPTQHSTHITSRLPRLCPSPSGDASPLVYVYPFAFRDVADVRRVLEALVEMGVVQTTETVEIAYKCDAYIELGVL